MLCRLGARFAFLKQFLKQAWPDHKFKLKYVQAHVELEINQTVIHHGNLRQILQLTLLPGGIAS